MLKINLLYKSRCTIQNDLKTPFKSLERKQIIADILASHTLKEKYNDAVLFLKYVSKVSTT